MEAAAELIGVSKNYRSGDPPALKNLTLRLPRNGVTVVFGPNGVGKSTLLRILALLEPPTSGSVKVLGVDARNSDSASLRGRVAMVFQDPIVFDRTVYDNIAYGVRLKNLADDPLDHVVREQAALLGLGSILGRNARTLSGGQKQRVVIARTLAIEPELLLLDEPNANLDNEGLHLLKRLMVERGRSSAVVASTPNLEYALSIGDYFVLLDRGELLFSGSKQEFTTSTLLDAYRY